MQRTTPILLLLFLFFAAALPMHARDRVGAFTTVEVRADEDIKDVVCAFCTVVLHGPIRGDLVTAFSDVTLASETEIGKSAVSAFTHFQAGENVSIAKDFVAFGSSGYSTGNLHVRGDSIAVPAFLAMLEVALPFCILYFVAWLIVRLIRGRRTYSEPPPGYPRV